MTRISLNITIKNPHHWWFWYRFKATHLKFPPPPPILQISHFPLVVDQTCSASLEAQRDIFMYRALKEHRFIHYSLDSRLLKENNARVGPYHDVKYSSWCLSLAASFISLHSPFWLVDLVYPLPIGSALIRSYYNYPRPVIGPLWMLHKSWPLIG